MENKNETVKNYIDNGGLLHEQCAIMPTDHWELTCIEFTHSKSAREEEATFSIRTDDIDALNDLFAKYVDEQQLCDVDIKNIRIINSAADFHSLPDFERDEE